MTITLVAIEVGLVVLGTCGTVLLWVHSLLVEWKDVAAYGTQGLVLALACLLSFYYNDLYDIRRVRSFGEFSVRLLQTIGVSFILLAALYTVFPKIRLDNGPFFSGLLMLACLVLPFRATMYAMMKAGSFSERVLILGTGPLALKIAAEMEPTPQSGYSIAGLVDDNGIVSLGAASQTPYPLLGRIEELEKTIEEVHPDRIVVALAERRGRLPVHDLLKTQMGGIAVEEGIEAYERLSGKLAVESVVPSYLIFSGDFQKPRWQMALHRTISLIVAAVGLLLTWPLMGMTALLIKLDSKGPLFFVQERVGFRERIFRLVKFRTMYDMRDNSTESVWDRDVDSRLTRVGRWIRRFYLDELPQFINIVKGDMDLVGPRPEMACNVAEMTEKIPYYTLRHVVRPGLTGWAQIKHGYSVNEGDVTEKIRYDLYYIKPMSLWLDLKILLDTGKIVLFGRVHADRVRT